MKPNKLQDNPLLEPHYEIIQRGGIYTICVYLNEDEIVYVSNLSKLKIKILNNEVFLQDETCYMYLEGVSQKVLTAILNKKSMLSIYYYSNEV